MQINPSNTVRQERQPTIGEAVRQLVQQCAAQAKRDLDSMRPGRHGYGGDLGQLLPHIAKEQADD